MPRSVERATGACEEAEQLGVVLQAERVQHATEFRAGQG
jgi:hypothetical protein